MRNFNYPYFSRDIAEFWRRWHISLSTWFRDYLYIPLGGSRGGMWMKVKNTLSFFSKWLLAWGKLDFYFLGCLNAIYFLPLLLTNNNRTHLGTLHRQVFTNLKRIVLNGSNFWRTSSFATGIL